ncbi:MAG: hypothetical protein ACE5JR_04930 [Gemmatimonadota bacterium]
MTQRSGCSPKPRFAPASLIVAALALFSALVSSGAIPLSSELAVGEIPAFARKYRTSCSTCHTAAPKLNVFGEAFRLNGYRFPENDKLFRKDRPVPLGGEPWKDLWPRAIWPGEIPGVVPLALRVQNDVQLTREAGSAFTWSFRFPQEIYLLAAATLGDDISVFLETEWSRERDLEVLQAKIEFQDLLPRLPSRWLNLWVGMQNIYLFTFADRQIDRAGRQNFLWQTYRISDLELRRPDTGDSLRSTNEFRLRQTQPALELNGIIGGRLYYGFGLAQGVGDLTTDNNNHKDVFYKVRYKIGGLGLDGRYGPGGGPVQGGGGQLLDRSLTIEHFGYFGAQPVDGDRQDDHRSFGISARVLYGPADIGVGYVWGENDNPWGASASGEVPYSSFFGKAEYLIFPWLIGSLKFDTFDADVPAALLDAGFTQGGADQRRILPGIIFLVRQNIRGVIEAELFTEHEASTQLNDPRPQNLWFRLDFAF